MNDIFIEQLVVRKNDQKTKIRKILYVVLALLLSFLAVRFIFSLSIILVSVIWFGVYYLFSRENVEFEYSFTSGELDVDKIINRKSRKHMITVDVREMIIMASKTRVNEFKELAKYDKYVDYSSGGDNTYIALFRMDKQIVKMEFEPNEQVLKSIRMYIPNKVKG